MLELSASGGGVSERASVSGDGSFNLRSVHPGVYDVRVYDGDALIHQETVMIASVNQPLSIHLREAPSTTSTRYPNTSISIQQLAHRVPPQARKAFEKGSLAEGNGDNERAAEYFREAVSIDPEFADAYNELGAVDAARGNLPQALEDFQKALNIVPEHPLALPNLSIVLAKLRRFHEAADVARRALRLSPGAGTLRYVLATSLYFEKGPTDEVLENLELAASEVPMAYLVAARLLDLKGKRDDAIRHVETFLRLAPADDKDRDRAKAMLAELRP
jgi:tetratricopeptide (TPR) repeat protein